MAFVRVRMASYRNLVDGEVHLAADRVFLIGENGQGKTNFLEALYVLSYASSFRGSGDAELVTHGAEGMGLSAWTTSEVGSSLPPEELRVEYSRGKKDIRRSGKKILDRKELIDLNPSVVFCHEDFDFAAGEPERRRFFFDQTASLVSPSYVDSLRTYKRILKQRNAALKERSLGLLDLLDEQLAAQGLSLIRERRLLEEALRPGFADLYEKVSLLGEEVGLAYKPQWATCDSVEDVLVYLRERRGDELALGTSLSGPHRDRWGFRRGGRDFAATASTGQLRLLSLALRSLQARHYTETTGRKPVLLFDDVLLELDPEKRRRFLTTIPEAAQAFFTFLPGEGWEDYRSDSILVYRVDHGRLSG